MILLALLTDVAGDVVRLQIEVRPVAYAFTNGTMMTSGGVFSGNTAQMPFSSMLNGTGYHWQVRAIDSSGATSPWVSFGGNAESEADFTSDINAVLNTAGSFNHGDSGGGSGCGLLVVKSRNSGDRWILLMFAAILAFALRRSGVIRLLDKRRS